jgi:hypothetical protein
MWGKIMDVLEIKTQLILPIRGRLSR